MLIHTIENYLALRRTLGYKLESTETMLGSFAKYAKTQGDDVVVTTTAIAWASLSTTIQQRDRRLKIIVSFARYIHAEDERHEIPPTDTYSYHRSRPTPYIFTPEELLRLIGEARKIGPATSIRPHTYGTLFGLLAVTGLRISEALALRVYDVTDDGLIIKCTKFQKDRLVPLHETTEKALNLYLIRRLAVPTEHDFLFVSQRRTPLCYSTARKAFRLLCVRAALPMQPHPRGLRLHDMRHTVAVRMLTNCPHGHKHVTPHMLALSTYLGHTSMHGTYWYLQSTPQLMLDINSASELWMAGVAP